MQVISFWLYIYAIKKYINRWQLNKSNKIQCFLMFWSQNEIEIMQIDHRLEEDKGSVENTTLDVDVYAQSFTGYAKFHRLVYIADHCPSHRMEALKIAIEHATTLQDVATYQWLHKKLTNENYALPDVAQRIPPYDPTWVQEITEKDVIKLADLRNDLKRTINQTR